MNTLLQGIIYKSTVTLICLTGALNYLRGQEVKVVTDFDFYFDNREFFTSYSPHYTVFGTRVAPGFHLVSKENHELHLGLWYQKDFGDQTNDEAPGFFGSYVFRGEYLDMELGYIPRKKIHMQRFLLNDTLFYSRPYLQGMSFFIDKENVTQELWLDWMSAQTDTIRESFMIGNTGFWHINRFYIHHEMLMIHHALPGKPSPDDHIRDNFGGLLSIGYQFNKKTVWDTLSIETGGLLSLDRLRSVYDWQTPGGIYIAMSLWKAGFGLNISHYQGNPHNLLYGDRFYTAKRYTRGDIIYRFFNRNNIQGEIKLSLHMLPEGLDVAQLFRVFYSFTTSNQ